MGTKQKFRYHTKHFKLNETTMEQLPQLSFKHTQELNTKIKIINDLKRKIRVQKERYDIILAKKKHLEKRLARGHGSDIDGNHPYYDPITNDNPKKKKSYKKDTDVSQRHNQNDSMDMVLGIVKIQ